MDDEDVRERTIYVGNLDGKMTQELLYELFLQSGPLKPCNVDFKLREGKPSFAFITFDHSVSVLYAVQLFDGVEVFGKQLRIKPRENSNNARKMRKLTLKTPKLLRRNRYEEEIYESSDYEFHPRNRKQWMDPDSDGNNDSMVLNLLDDAEDSPISQPWSFHPHRSISSVLLNSPMTPSNLGPSPGRIRGHFNKQLSEGGALNRRQQSSMRFFDDSEASPSGSSKSFSEGRTGRKRTELPPPSYGKTNKIPDPRPQFARNRKAKNENPYGGDKSWNQPDYDQLNSYNQPCDSQDGASWDESSYYGTGFVSGPPSQPKKKRSWRGTGKQTVRHSTKCGLLPRWKD